MFIIALATWKRFRWLDWALKQNICANLQADPITELRLVCGMTKLDVIDTVYVPSTKKADISSKKTGKKDKRTASDKSKIYNERIDQFS